MEPMLLVTVNQVGAVLCQPVFEDVDEVEDTTDTALCVLNALYNEGIEVCQMLVIDTSIRVHA